MTALLNDHKWVSPYFKENAGLYLNERMIFNGITFFFSVQGSPIIALRARLLTMVTDYGAILARGALPASKRIQLTALIKLYCVLVGLLKLKLESEEMNAILSLLMQVQDERCALCAEHMTLPLTSYIFLLVLSSLFRIAKLGLCWAFSCEGLLHYCSKVLLYGGVLLHWHVDESLPRIG